MSKIFFIGSALPPLMVGQELEWSFEQLIEFFALNLPRKVMGEIEKIRRYLDLVNVRQLLRQQPLDPRAFLSEKELNEALIQKEGLPNYLYTYLDTYESEEEQERYYSRVFISFFSSMEKKTKGFLRFYFNFEREWRLVLTGLRAKRLGIDLAAELQYEDFTDPLVAELLAQKETKQFAFPFAYKELGLKLEGTEGNPMAEHLAMTQFLFDSIQERIQDTPFSLDAILGYLVQFMLIEDDNRLSETEGKERLLQIGT